MEARFVAGGFSRWQNCSRITVSGAPGSDYSFPPADLDPIATVRKGGFADAEVAKILDENALKHMPRLHAA
jgi:hypothetical protein